MSETTTVDWREVFKKYATYVAECEGTDFLGGPWESPDAELGGFQFDLAPEEVDEVRRARNEARGTNQNESLSKDTNKAS